jgi:hypothetical protein
MPRPCVTIAEERNSTTTAVLEGTLVSLNDSRTIRLQNVGTGQAVNVRVAFRSPSTPQADDSFRAPILGPEQVFDSGITTNALPDPALVRIEYESVGGLKYLTEVEVEGRRWVRGVRFSQPNPALEPTVRT